MPDDFQLEQLRDLKLSGTNLTEVDGLTGLTALRSLNLEGTQIPSGAAAILKTLPALEDLDLSNSRVDEFVLLELAKMKQLKRIRLAGVDLSTAALARFGKVLPQCKVEME